MRLLKILSRIAAYAWASPNTLIGRPFFLLAYAASSAWQFVHGRSVYYDNYFERQARRA